MKTLREFLTEKSLFTWSEIDNLERLFAEWISIQPIKALQSTPKIEAEGKGLPTDDRIHEVVTNYAYNRGGDYWYDALYAAVDHGAKWMRSQLQSLPKEPTPLRDELLQFMIWTNIHGENGDTVEKLIDGYIEYLKNR